MWFPSDSVGERTACLTRFIRSFYDSDCVRAVILYKSEFLPRARFDCIRYRRMFSKELLCVIDNHPEFAITAVFNCSNKSFREIVRGIDIR